MKAGSTWDERAAGQDASVRAIETSKTLTSCHSHGQSAHQRAIGLACAARPRSSDAGSRPCMQHALRTKMYRAMLCRCGASSRAPVHKYFGFLKGQRVVHAPQVRPARWQIALVTLFTACCQARRRVLTKSRPATIRWLVHIALQQCRNLAGAALLQHMPIAHLPHDLLAPPADAAHSDGAHERRAGGAVQDHLHGRLWQPKHARRQHGPRVSWRHAQGAPPRRASEGPRRLSMLVCGGQTCM